MSISNIRGDPTVATKKRQKNAGQHGGRREGSGKPTFFRGKYTGDGKKASLQMSEEAFDMLDKFRAKLETELVKRPGDGFPRELSRNSFLEALVRKAGGSLTTADIFRLDR